MKRSALLSLIFMVAACGGSAVPVPTAADATRGSSHFPDLTLTELSHGRKLYLSRCGSCHALRRPSELAAEQWQAELDEMRSKNGVKLSDAEARAILRYLVIAGSTG